MDPGLGKHKDFQGRKRLQHLALQDRDEHLLGSTAEKADPRGAGAPRRDGVPSGKSREHFQSRGSGSRLGASERDMGGPPPCASGAWGRGGARAARPVSPPTRRENPGGTSNPEEAALGSERRNEIWAALHHVRAEHGAALILRHMEGLSYGEVAEGAGVPVGTAKGWARRA